MAGGYKFAALLVCAQLAAEGLDFMNQRVKNNWASEGEKEQHERYWQYIQ